MLETFFLDIGPQKDGYSTKLFSKNFDYRTLDINPDSNADIIANICWMPEILSETFNAIICTEVVEHTKNPFSAIAELHRILKPGGYLLLTTPFNLRIHGPSPDCWRFTEEGLKILLEPEFEIIELRSIVPLLRREMPIHYTVIAQKVEHKKGKHE
jgi:SAM-dependent methyltransferase